MAKRRRSRRGAAIAIGLGLFAGLLVLTFGAGAVWAALAGLGVFGASWGTTLLLGSGADASVLDGDDGLSNGDGLG